MIKLHKHNLLKQFLNQFKQILLLLKENVFLEQKKKNY